MLPSGIIPPMLAPNEIESRLEKILLAVQKPGRYVGGELNSVLKDWDTVAVRTALVFPEIYDLGVSNLGIQILYDLINRRADALAERAYAPWTDMDEKMRANGIPLYTLESKHALADFDLIGFSLPYESLYTNVLNLLDLAGLPLRAADRTAVHPLVIAGGHACYNPEPMHAFIDAFVIGEGEAVLLEIIDLLKAAKDGGKGRDELLQGLAGIEGVYVPRFYEVQTKPDGSISGIVPKGLGIPAVVRKRMLPALPPPVTRFIVPNIEAVHNRVSIEVMRGCSRGCRFCQAGMVMRPVRERSVEEVVQAAEDAIRSSGFEELALLSLSSSDYTPILELVQAIGAKFADSHLTVSLPSLRIESVSVDLMERLRDRRSSGFTLAPEAASERMRRTINKYIPDEQILETVRQIYSRKWTTIKLYFMIGLPGETLDDVQAIADLCKRVIAEGRQALGGKARLNVGVSTFIPKAHTPFQWAALDRLEQIEAKQDLLRRALRDRSIKLTWTDPQDTLLEALLSRGDRRMAEVIETAWRRGAKFDAWQEHARHDLWLAALAEQGLEAQALVHRVRGEEEIFPWEHISSAVRRKYLLAEYRNALNGVIRPDCREQCFACGILPAFADARREHPGNSWKGPEVKTPPATVGKERR